MTPPKLPYVQYLKKFPQVYQHFAQVANRTEHLGQFLRQNDRFQPREGMSLLSIGCGEGELEIQLARESRMSLTLVDPVKSYIDIAKSSKPDAETHISTFQEFESSSKFDFVFFIHSWYGIGLDSLHFERALNWTKSGGVLMINLMSRTSPVNAISELSNSDGISLTSEAVSDFASYHGFIHTFEMESAWRPQEIFLDQSGLTSKAKDFCSFLLASPWEQCDLETKEKCEYILKSHAHELHIPLHSGTLWFEKE